MITKCPYCLNVWISIENETKCIYCGKSLTNPMGVFGDIFGDMFGNAKDFMGLGGADEKEKEDAE
jgi:ribosomal protein S27E